MSSKKGPMAQWMIFASTILAGAVIGCAGASSSSTPEDDSSAATAEECVEPDPNAPRKEVSGEVSLEAPCIMTVPAQESAQQAPEAPPANSLEEEKPAAPDSSYVWATGYWYWTSARYVWVPGYWTAPRAGYVWVNGQWRLVDGVWTYYPGGWAAAGTTTVVITPVRAVRVVHVRPVPRVVVVSGGRVVVRPAAVNVTPKTPRNRRRSVRRRVRRF